ncbi:hypothetical protein ACP275_01G057200 [Erythranthe tilingii]
MVVLAFGCFGLQIAMAPRKRGSKDIAWNHCAVVDPSETKHLRCNYCGKDYWGGVTRMKHHLAGIRNECTICEKVPDEVKEIFAKLLSSKKTKNETNNLEVLDEEIVEDVGKERGGLHPFFSKKGPTLKIFDFKILNFTCF